MTIELYGNPFSTCTRLVGAILAELNIPFKFHVVDLMKGEQKAPDYVANLQPFGIIPAIVS